MIKKAAALFLVIYVNGANALSGLTACAPALPSNSPSFCQSFKNVAACYCTASGLPAGMCGNMNLLYNRMLGTFGSLQRACAFQHNTTTQVCLDDWNCYRSGGKNAQNQLCSGTGKACPN